MQRDERPKLLQIRSLMKSELFWMKLVSKLPRDRPKNSGMQNEKLRLGDASERNSRKKQSMLRDERKRNGRKKRRLAKKSERSSGKKRKPNEC